MKRGCVFGCIIVAGLVALLALLALVALDWLDVLREAPAVPVEDYATPAPALFMRAQLDRPEVTKLLTDALDQTPTWLIEKFTPHEITFTVDPVPEAGHNELVIALNLKRLTGFLDFAMRDTDEWRFWLDQEIVSAGQEADGLYVIRSTIPFDPAMIQPLAPTEVEAPSISAAPPEDHVLQFHVDNRGGRALVAIAPLLTQKPAEYDPARAPLANLAQLEGYFKRFLTASAAVDLLESGELGIAVHISVPDEASGESLLFFLMMLRDTLFRELLKNNLILEGFWSTNDLEIKGEFTILGFRQKAMEYIRARAN